MKDAIIKKIEGYHHLRTILWTVLVVLGGGTANKISNLNSPIDISLAVVGGLLMAIIFKELINITTCLKKRYKQLEELQ